MTKVVLKIRNKGISILPKSLREIAGIGESEVIAEAREGEIVIRPLKPKVIDIKPHIIETLLREKSKLEEEKFKRIFSEVRS